MRQYSYKPIKGVEKSCILIVRAYILIVPVFTSIIYVDNTMDALMLIALVVE